MYIYIYIFICIYIYICILIYMHKHLSIYLCMYDCIYLSIFLSIYIYIYIYVCVYIYLYIEREKGRTTQERKRERARGREGKRKAQGTEGGAPFMEGRAAWLIVSHNGERARGSESTCGQTGPKQGTQAIQDSCAVPVNMLRGTTCPDIRASPPSPHQRRAASVPSASNTSSLFSG